MSALDAPALRSRFNSTVCLLDYTAPKKDIGPTIFNGISLGNVEIYSLKNPSLLHGWRTIEHIRADGVNDFLVFMPLKSERKVCQAGRSSVVAPDSFMLLTTAKPFVSDCASSAYDEYLLRIPGPLLRQRIANVDDYCCQSMKVRPGFGHILHSLVALAVEEGVEQPANYARQFGGTVIDTVAHAVLNAPEIDASPSLWPQSAQERIHERALEYIEQHLADPGLGVATISAYCRISLRTLHAAFAAAGTTVGSCIRDARLQRCREALRNPSMGGRLIIEIATQWGFSDAAHFSHVYKARYGRSPREERALALRDARTGDG